MPADFSAALSDRADDGALAELPGESARRSRSSYGGCAGCGGGTSPYTATAITPRARSGGAAEKSAGTGYGERRVDHVLEVEFVAQSNADSRHFIKYEWRDTLCRKHLLECGEKNRFWDESTLGFAPPPPRRR